MIQMSSQYTPFVDLANILYTMPILAMRNLHVSHRVDMALVISWSLPHPIVNVLVVLCKQHLPRPSRCLHMFSCMYSLRTLYVCVTRRARSEVCKDLGFIHLHGCGMYLID